MHGAIRVLNACMDAVGNFPSKPPMLPANTADEFQPTVAAYQAAILEFIGMVQSRVAKLCWDTSMEVLS